MRELLLTMLLHGATARAQQPLDVFLSASESVAADAVLAELSADAARSRVGSAGGALLPSLSLSGGYTRNQEEVSASFPGDDGVLQSAVITARDQLDATARVELALVDVSAWSRYLRARADAGAADARALTARMDVHVAVITAWHRLVASRALVDSAAVSRDTARANLDVVRAREAAGLASMLDVERARADGLTAEQVLAEAELEVALASRQLEQLTGITPDASPARLPDPGEEAPLEAWLARVDALPAVDAADADVLAARRAQLAAVGQLLPSVSVFAAERFTNASGFGPSALWSAGVQARWALDFTRRADAAVEGASLASARVRAERARADVQTALHDSWHRARSLAVRVGAARAAEQASERGASIARARWDAGTGNQLEVSQAERDLLSARVARIRAEADLSVARLTLRLRAGLPPSLEVGP